MMFGCIVLERAYIIIARDLETTTRKINYLKSLHSVVYNRLGVNFIHILLFYIHLLL